MFAKRTDWKLTLNKSAVALEGLRRAGVPILDLTESNPTRCSFSSCREQILAAFADPRNLSYTPCARGDLRAREAVCAYYQAKNMTVDPERIFLTASTSEAYSFLFRLLANPGERVLFPRPGYPLFEFLADMNDIVPGFYPLTYAGKWGIDLEKFYSAISPDTKAMVLVNPNNPTGSFVKQEELSKISQVCRDRNIPIISDEVFWDYPAPSVNHACAPMMAGKRREGGGSGFRGFDSETSVLNSEERGKHLSFCLGGLSKSLGLPQMKLSWIIINGPGTMVDAAASRLEIIADTYLSVNTPSQNALEEWFRRQPIIQKEIIRRITRNREFLTKCLSSSSYGGAGTLLHSEGGWYAILKFSGEYSEEQLILDLLKEDRVLVHPGYFYDFYQESYIVLSLLPREDIFQEGVSRLARRLKPVMA